MAKPTPTNTIDINTGGSKPAEQQTLQESDTYYTKRKVTSVNRHKRKHNGGKPFQPVISRKPTQKLRVNPIKTKQNQFTKRQQTLTAKCNKTRKQNSSNLNTTTKGKAREQREHKTPQNKDQCTANSEPNDSQNQPHDINNCSSKTDNKLAYSQHTHEKSHTSHGEDKEEEVDTSVSTKLELPLPEHHSGLTRGFEALNAGEQVKGSKLELKLVRVETDKAHRDFTRCLKEPIEQLDSMTQSEGATGSHYSEERSKNSGIGRENCSGKVLAEAKLKESKARRNEKKDFRESS